MVNNDCKNITFPMICQGQNSKEILTLAMNYDYGLWTMTMTMNYEL